jgi:hypothetical protein
MPTSHYADWIGEPERCKHLQTVTGDADTRDQLRLSQLDAFGERAVAEQRRTARRS